MWLINLALDFINMYLLVPKYWKRLPGIFPWHGLGPRIFGQYLCSSLCRGPSDSQTDTAQLRLDFQQVKH